ncbi:hypothetical protein ACNOYE_40010 [Nannocystaceae bacterium ST9]
MIAGLLSACLLASAPTTTEVEAAAKPAPTLESLDQRRFEVHLLPRFGMRLLDAVELGGSIQVGVGVRLWKGLFLDLEFGEGLYAPPLQLGGQILAGLRWELRKSARVRPNFFAGLTHLHQSHGDDFVHEPGHSLLGTAKTIHHRTGAQLGFGLRFPFPAAWGKQAPRFSGLLRTDVSYYFDGAPGRLQAGLGAGVSVVF